MAAPAAPDWVVEAVVKEMASLEALGVPCFVRRAAQNLSPLLGVQEDVLYSAGYNARRRARAKRKRDASWQEQEQCWQEWGMRNYQNHNSKIVTFYRCKSDCWILG